MTLPDAERVASGLERWTGRIVIFCAVGTCLCFIGFAYLQVRVSGQSAQGQMARLRQQVVFPVSLKVYVDAERRGVITREDLACFRDSSKCPPAKPTP